MILTLLDQLRHEGRRRRWSPEQATGRHGEDLAHRYLQKRGYIVVARNYRLSAGDAEADIIAWDGDELVIVEVKTRESEAFGPPERAIDEDKRRALMRVAREYARKSNTPESHVRCDAVSVILSRPPRIELFRNAVRLRVDA
ncbi:MAG: YraN family protein [Bryobacteraceae bacterium]